MSIQPRSASLPTCNYEGNSDIYGLGIRVGIYLQWVSGLLSKLFLEEKDLRDVLNENAIFLFAIFLATVLLVTDTISGVHSVDVLIMLHIFFGSIYTIFVDEHIAARIEYFSSLMGILFKSGVATGMAAIGLWFWFYDTPVPLNPDCSQYAFLFGRVGFYSKSTIMAFKAFAVINLMVCAAFFLNTIVVRINVWIFRAYLVSKHYLPEKPQGSTDKTSLTSKLRGWIISGSVPAKTDYFEEYNTLQMQAIEEYEQRMKTAYSWASSKPIRIFFQSLKFMININRLYSWQTHSVDAQQLKTLESFPLGEKYLGLVGLFSVARRNDSPRKIKSTDKMTLNKVINRFIQQSSVLVGNIAVMIYSIINIELLIRYNKITGVYTLQSTGQIIPFIIGIASLWKTCWQIITSNIEYEINRKSKEQGEGYKLPQTTQNVLVPVVQGSSVEIG